MTQKVILRLISNKKTILFKVDTWSSVNHKQSENEKNQQEQICQIAKLISAHVSEILIQRLNMEEKSQVSTKYGSHKENPNKQYASSPEMKNKYSKQNRRARSHSRNSEKTGNIRFHSEYRLNRTTRPTATPLENRAFQLRRKSLEARKGSVNLI
ncbi:unnamed protein product [Auanema sp. JU1783]|nr:unnamed protein product [Auanema sp. JU1783]